jgi:hypothetical protein
MAEAKETAADDGVTIVKLRKEIQVHDEKVTELRLREPTAADIEKAGVPVVMDFSGELPKVTFDERKMSAMLSLLATAPPSSIRAMHTKDWLTAAWAIAGFFVPDLGT